MEEKVLKGGVSGSVWPLLAGWASDSKTTVCTAGEKNLTQAPNPFLSTVFYSVNSY